MREQVSLLKSLLSALQASRSISGVIPAKPAAPKPVGKLDKAVSILRSSPDLMHLTGRQLEKWALDNGEKISYHTFNDAKKEVEKDQ